MSPQQRIAQSQVLTYALMFVNFGWALYLFITPQTAFEQNSIWQGVLGAIPFHDLTLLGVAMLTIALGISLGAFIHSHLIFGLALVFGMGTWGLLTYSFGFAAATSEPAGLGMGGVISGALTISLHGFVLYYRK